MNDFVIRFATVNGTGSASANGIVAKTLFRCGMTIGPKNMFPSNIQGMPTWYDIRVSDHNYSSRKELADLLVSANRNSVADDIKAVRKGGYVLFDSTGGFEPAQIEGLNYLPLPMTGLALEAFPTSPKRFMLQNLIYVGAVSALLNIPVPTFHTVIKERYGKKKGVDDDLQAFDLGFQYATKNFSCPLPFHIEAKSPDSEKIMIEGNYAMALGCLYAGATVVGWYPITPSTGLVEHFSALCERHRKDPETGRKRFALIQAEDELTAIGIVIGAAWNGARSFTATSGPGFSLMNEFLGYAYYAEIPTVLFNVQRCGPSTGLPTRNQQADILQAAYASHGDTKHILLFPSDPAECFQFAYDAFDLAERYQTPVIVMAELEVAMNEFISPPLKWTEKAPDRGKLLRKDDFEKRGKPFFRYLDEDGDGVPYRSLPGDDPRLAYFTRGSGHDRFGRYTEDPKAYADNMERLAKKFTLLAEKLPAPQFTPAKAKSSSSACVLFFGSTKEVMGECIDALAAADIHLDCVRIRAFPFTAKLAKRLHGYETLYIVEQNRDGQMRKLLSAEIEMPPHVESICFFDGMPLVAENITSQIRARIAPVL